MLRSVLLVLSGNAAAAALGLVRNLAVAALVPVADFGIAATFAVMVTAVEMVTQFGLQQQIIQSSDGDDPRLQSGLQGFQILRGVLASGLVLLLAAPFAAFLRTPELAWAYQVMALMPLMGSLQHFDIDRLTRHRRYGPIVAATTLPAALSLAAVWPLAAVFGDFRVMLYAVLVQGAAGVVLSHLVAERPYRARLDPAVIRRGLAFGWPLMLNTVLLFAVFQGDKLIVGRELGFATLAIFAMGLTLTLTPVLVTTRSLQNLFLPPLALAQEAPARFRPLAAATLQAAALAALALALALPAAAAAVVWLLLGPGYAALVPLLPLLALLAAVRMAKGGPAVVALAAGESRNAMHTNLPRVAVLPLAWWVAVHTGDLRAVLGVALAAECLGLVLAVLLMRRRVGAAAGAGGGTQAAVAAGLGLVAVWALLPQAQGGVLPPPWLALALAGCAAAAVWRAKELRAYLRQHLRPGRG